MLVDVIHIVAFCYKLLNISPLLLLLTTKLVSFDHVLPNIKLLPLLPNIHNLLFFQEFPPEYTSNYLLQFLMDANVLRLGIPARSQVVSVAVGTPGCTQLKRMYCRMRLQESGKGLINVGWTAVVNKFNLQVGDVCLFTFQDDRKIPITRRDPFAWLRLDLVKLEPEA